MENKHPVTLNGNIGYFLAWVSERMEIFWRRQHGQPRPWTEDKILARHKFTNVYRILDKTSQYLIEHVIHQEGFTQEEMFWRIVIFKHFNKIETWQLLEQRFGDMFPREVSFEAICKVLDDAMDDGIPIYSNAYMTRAADATVLGLPAGTSKHRQYFHLFKTELIDKGIVEEVLKATSIEDCYNALKKMWSMGDFTAYQWAQDLSYSKQFNFEIGDFCAIGPGTERGLKRCFNDLKPVDYQCAIKFILDSLPELMEEHGFIWNPLPDYEMTVADICNCFCEADKYMRGLGIDSGVKGKRIKQVYKENDLSFKGEYVTP